MRVRAADKIAIGSIVELNIVQITSLAAHQTHILLAANRLPDSKFHKPSFRPCTHYDASLTARGGAAWIRFNNMLITIAYGSLVRRGSLAERGGSSWHCVQAILPTCRGWPRLPASHIRALTKSTSRSPRCSNISAAPFPNRNETSPAKS